MSPRSRSTSWARSPTPPTIIRALHRGEKRLVFCDSRSRVEQLALLLREQEIETFVSHSSLGAEERRLAEQAFAQRQNCVIVATSSLELGIDVGDLDRVIQIDAPATVSSFLQRMGRTGRRAGTTSNCLFLATTDESLLRAAALVRLWRQGFVEPVDGPAQAVSHPGPAVDGPVPPGAGHRPIGVVRLDRSRFPPSRGWTGSLVAALVEHSMIASQILWSDEGILAFAPEGEAKYGRKNFMELLSVFTSPPLFRVLCGRKELGFVHESTFFKRDDGPAVLLLAGRCWRATHLDWRRRIAHVEPTDQSGKSRWLGEGQFLGYRVCQAIRDTLAEDAVEPYWSRRSVARFGELREEFPWVRSDSTALVRNTDGEVRWWTFAGGVANTILAHQLGRSRRGEGKQRVHHDRRRSADR